MFTKNFSLIKNYSIRTIKGYRNNNKAFMNFLCKKFTINEVEEVSTTHIKAYLMYIKMNGQSLY
ncbi:phage integrase N-terminal SAM-like domain-containing protein [Paenibacillus illinoisensis]|uniref:phage integrase N-terminal SAM-like domain-containing protein n=1 Tax=Paenibacillus illinoisensis TaxID=59845 RepID=UPI003D2771B9